MKPASKPRRLSRTTLVLVFAGSVGVSAAAASLTAPDTPDWILPDGSIDMSKAPECVGVAGPDGQALVGEDGIPVLVPFVEPDDLLPMDELQQVETAEELQELRERYSEIFDAIEARAQSPALMREHMIALGKGLCYD